MVILPFWFVSLILNASVNARNITQHWMKLSSRKLRRASLSNLFSKWNSKCFNRLWLRYFKLLENRDEGQDSLKHLAWMKILISTVTCSLYVQWANHFFGLLRCKRLIFHYVLSLLNSSSRIVTNKMHTTFPQFQYHLWEGIKTLSPLRGSPLISKIVWHKTE